MNLTPMSRERFLSFRFLLSCEGCCPAEADPFLIQWGKSKEHLRVGMCGKFILSILTALLWHVQFKTCDKYQIKCHYHPIDFSRSSMLPEKQLGRTGTLLGHAANLTPFPPVGVYAALTSTQTKLEQTDAQRVHCLPRWSLNWQMSRNHKKF